MVQSCWILCEDDHIPPPCPSQDWSGVKTVLCIGVRRTKTESIQREQLKEVEDLEANLDVNVEGKKKDLRALRRKPLSNIWRVWRDYIFSEWPELVQWGPVTIGSCVLSCIQLFVTPWTVAHQVPLSMGFSRLEYWSRLPFPSPGDLPDPRIEPSYASCVGRQVLYH